MHLAGLPRLRRDRLRCWRGRFGCCGRFCALHFAVSDRFAGIQGRRFLRRCRCSFAALCSLHLAVLNESPVVEGRRFLRRCGCSFAALSPLYLSVLNESPVVEGRRFLRRRGRVADRSGENVHARSVAQAAVIADGRRLRSGGRGRFCVLHGFLVKVHADAGQREENQRQREADCGGNISGFLHRFPLLSSICAAAPD